MMKVNKKGEIGTAVQQYIVLFVLVIVLFLVVAELIPEAETAGNAINNTSAPLGSLFQAGGVVFTIIMAGLLLLIVKRAMPKK